MGFCGYKQIKIRDHTLQNDSRHAPRGSTHKLCVREVQLFLVWDANSAWSSDDINSRGAVVDEWQVRSYRFRELAKRCQSGRDFESLTTKSAKRPDAKLTTLISIQLDQAFGPWQVRGRDGMRITDFGGREKTWPPVLHGWRPTSTRWSSPEQ